MDFIGLFPESNEHDYLWVVLFQLTSMVHLVPVKTMIQASQLAWLFVKEIVHLHGLPETIVSDCDTKFTSQFWGETHRILGVRLLMSTAFHPQMDRASERLIRMIAQILRSMISPDQKDWAEKVPMVKFAINSSIKHKHAPKVAPGVQSFVCQARDNFSMALDAIIKSRVIQTHHANKQRKASPTLDIGELVYLSTKNLTLPKG